MDRRTLVKKLFASFPNSNADKATVLVYAERLASIPDEELEVLINQAIDTCKFLPTIAELKELHAKLYSDVNVDKAAEGWASVRKAMSWVGSWGGTPTFKDPVVQKVVETMGWQDICATENIHITMSQFFKLYEMYARRVIADQRLLPEYRELRHERLLTTQEQPNHDHTTSIVKRVPNH